MLTKSLNCEVIEMEKGIEFEYEGKKVIEDYSGWIWGENSKSVVAQVDAAKAEAITQQLKILKDEKAKKEKEQRDLEHAGFKKQVEEVLPQGYIVSYPYERDVLGSRRVYIEGEGVSGSIEYDPKVSSGGFFSRTSETEVPWVAQVGYDKRIRYKEFAKAIQKLIQGMKEEAESRRLKQQREQTQNEWEESQKERALALGGEFEKEYNKYSTAFQVRRELITGVTVCAGLRPKSDMLHGFRLLGDMTEEQFFKLCKFVEEMGITN